jgi:PAS domain S-box-containing protein
MPASNASDMPSEAAAQRLPPATGRDPAIRRFVIGLVLAICALNLLVAAIVAVIIHTGREQHRAQATALVASLSSVLQANLDGLISRIDLTLLTVADEIRRQERAGGIVPDQLNDVLRRHDARLPETLGLRVVDAAGIIRHGVTGIMVPQASIADRPQFIRLRDDPQAGLVISRPLLGRAANAWMVTLSRRLSAPDGSFAGAVHMALPLDRLAETLASVRLGHKGAVGLWNGEASIVARVPDLVEPGRIYTMPPSPSPTLQRLIAERTGKATYRAPSGGDGVVRTHSLHRIGSLPLWVVVGLAEEDYLADWNRQSAILAWATALFALISSATGWLFFRSWLSRHRAALALAEAHGEVEEARRRLELILGSAGEGICGVDRDGRVIFVNGAARRMLGWKDDEGIGLNLHEEAHHHRADGSEYPSIACPIWQTLHDGAIRHVPRDVHWRRDGTAVPVEFTTAPIIQDGLVTGAVTMFRDITRRLRTEAEASRNMAATMAIGNLLRHSLETRPLDDILHDALVEILGLPWLNLEEKGSIFLAEAGGPHLRLAAWHKMSPDIVRLCASVEIGQCLCGTAARRREAVFAAHVDHRHSTATIGMRGHGHYCVPILYGAELLGVLNTYVAEGHQWQKEEERFLKMAADTLAGIIWRARMEQTLKDGEELSKALLNANIDGALLLDRDGRILAVNEALAARFDTSPATMAGTDFFVWLPPAMAEARRRQLDRVLADRVPVHLHDERDGIGLDNRIYPIPDADGEVRRIAVFSRDVTQQRAAQRAADKALADLARSNAELEQFAYVASHDLREPLRAITGHLQLLERQQRGKLDDLATESLHFAVDGAKRMDALIRDLLDYSRIGHADRCMEPLELGEVMADALANLSATIADNHASVSVSTPMPGAHGNRMELVRLFQNLIGNALKYRADDRPPAVEIAATATDGRWEIAIRDNGIGIEPEYFERIFMIFQRLHGRDRYEGTGIGLAVCRKIVERHGGSIRVESQPGTGSTFTVSLPMAGPE